MKLVLLLPNWQSCLIALVKFVSQTSRFPALLLQWAGPSDPAKLDYNVDALFVFGPSWTMVTKKLGVVVGLWSAERVAEARRQLVDLYTLLLPLPFFDSGCVVINKHKYLYSILFVFL